ncbi:hypothetical protein V1514DRAFT_367496 [Lipomyces japonicus]|uniref:uncharacterized protein n=1 Tax=Lipomyces japonicus TaxID=56871 RepID=UPI0034CEFD8E
MAVSISYTTAIFVTGMLITGAANSLLSKYQDNQCVANCDGPADQRRYFEQPVIQTFQMFIGEALCWTIVFGELVYTQYRSPSQPIVAPSEEDEESVDEADLLVSSDPNMSLLASNPAGTGTTVGNLNISKRTLDGNKIFGLSIPALCDICGTTLMNVGLFFTPVSIYQMTRGALVLFVGLFSVFFLNRRLAIHQWTALGAVVLGIFIVGLSGTIYAPNTDAGNESEPSRGPNSFLQVAIGVFVIALAQIFTATQFVYEEHLLRDYHLDSIRVVGWEGIFGFLLTFVIMIASYVFVGKSESGRSGYFDIPTGFSQIFANRLILISSLLIMISISSFNFFGVSVTQRLSATSRSTIDTCRTIAIWVISISLGWEQFRVLQLFGFVLVVYGTLLFNGVISPYIFKQFEYGRVRLADDDNE